MIQNNLPYRAESDAILPPVVLELLPVDFSFHKFEYEPGRTAMQGRNILSHPAALGSIPGPDVTKTMLV